MTSPVPEVPEVVPAPSTGSIQTPAPGLVARVRALARSRELRNTLLYVVSSAFGAALGILTLPLFSRYLTAEDFGTVGYVTAVNAFLAPFFVLRLDSYYIQRYYTADAAGRRELLGGLVSFVTVWSVLATALFGVLAYVAFWQLHVSVPFFPFMAVMLASNLPLGWFTFATLEFRVQHRAWGYAWLTILQAALMAGVGLALVAWYHTGAEGRLWGTLIGSAGAGVVALLTLRGQVDVRLPSRETLRAALAFALPLLPVSLIALLFDSVDRILIERFATLADLGYYNIAMQYGGAIALLSVSIYRAYEPSYFEMAAQQRFAAMARSFSFITLLFFGTALGMLVLSRPAITLLTHGRMAASVPLANLLLISFFLKAVYLLTNVLLITLNRTKLMMWTSVLGLVLYIGANYALLAGFGVRGAAYAKVVPMVVLIGTSVVWSGQGRQFRGFLLLTAALSAMLAALAFWL